MKILIPALIALSLAGCNNILKEKGSEFSTNNVCNNDATFCIASVDAKAIELNDVDSLGNVNKKQFNFTACVTDPLGRSINTLREFSISDGKSSQKALADGNGCFLWTEVHTVDPYTRSTYFVIERTVTATQGHSGSTSFKFKFNPWASDVLYSLYRDIPVPANYKVDNSTVYFNNTVTAQSVGGTATTVVGLNNISLGTFRHDKFNYEVDEDLNLTFAHLYRVNFSPTILRQSFGNLFDELSARQGKVRATIVFMRDNASNPDLTDYANYITHIEHDFTVNRTLGTIKEDVVFKWPDVSALETRLRVLVSIKPLVETNAIRKAYFEGNVASMPSGTIDLMNTRLDVEAILSRFRQLSSLEKSKEKPAERYIEAMKEKYKTFIELNDSDLTCDPNKLAAESKYECEQNKGKTVANLFNAMRYSRSTSKDITYGRELEAVRKVVAKKLGRNAFEVSTVKRVYTLSFVDKILQKYLTPENFVRTTVPGQITTSESFGISYNQGYNSSANAGWSAGLGFNPLGITVGDTAKALKIFGESAGSIGLSPSLGVSVGTSGGWSVGYASSSSGGVGMSRSYTINYQEFPILIRAMVSDCVFVEAELASIARAKEKSVAFYHCNKPLAREFVESYYNIYDSMSQTNGQDNSSLERKWVMFIRGAPYFDLFKGMVANKVVNFSIFNPVSIKVDENLFANGKVYDEIAAYKAKNLRSVRMTQVMPGLIYAPVVFKATNFDAALAESKKVEARAKAALAERQRILKVRQTTVFE